MNNGHLTDLTSDAQLKTPVIHGPLEGFLDAIRQSILTMLKQLLLLFAFFFLNYIYTEQALVKQTSATDLVQLF